MDVLPSIRLRLELLNCAELFSYLLYDWNMKATVKMKKKKVRRVVKYEKVV